MAIEAIDNGHSYSKMTTEYKIPKSNLRDHINDKIRSRKMNPKGVLRAEEEIALCLYIEKMADFIFSLTPP